MKFLANHNCAQQKVNKTTLTLIKKKDRDASIFCQENDLHFFDETYASLKNKINNIAAKYNDICIKYERETNAEKEFTCVKEKFGAKTKNFISESKKKFGDKFDYTMTKYNGAKKKLIVICKFHGKCEQKPGNHFRSIHGCMKCSTNFSKTNINEMLEKAKKIHSNKYDYSKVVYKSKCNNVTIICPKHGDFQKTIKNHVRLKQGCQLCAKEGRNGKMIKNVTTESFIEEANLKHNFKYDYYETEYVNARTKIKIKCLEHGFFWQIPSSHALVGRGCPKCNKGIPYTTDSFIKKCRKIHGDFYNYDKVNYVNSKTNVIIICQKHGEFKQTPDSHLNKSARCPTCATDSTAALLSNTIDDFIAKSKQIHGDIYIYNKTIYNGYFNPVTIICPNHGKFIKTPATHMFKKSGCPKCNMCPGCQLWATAGKLCSYCRPKDTNVKYQKTKEWKIVNFLKKELLDKDFIHNRSVGTTCTPNRIFPDVLFDMDTHHVIVEIDEHQHRGANYNCEEKRMRDIIANLGTSCYFIRYNPDNKKSDKMILLGSVKKSFDYDEIKDKFDEHGFAAEYLFYK